MTTRNVGYAYSVRRRGVPLENCQKALMFLDGTLDAIPRKTHRVEWAKTHIAYGNIWSKQVFGEMTRNLEASAERYRSALEVFEPGILPT